MNNWKTGNLLLSESFGYTPHLLLHLQELFIAHLPTLKQRKPIDIHVMCSSLMVYFPPQVVVFISYLIESFSKLLHLNIKTISHGIQPFLLLLFLVYPLIDLINLLRI